MLVAMRGRGKLSEKDGGSKPRLLDLPFGQGTKEEAGDGGNSGPVGRKRGGGGGVGEVDSERGHSGEGRESEVCQLNL